MKKIISVVLVALMILSLSVSAFAEEMKDTCEEVGITITYPDEFDKIKGIVLPMGMSSSKANEGVYNIMITYCAFSQEFSDELNAKSASGTITEEDIDMVTNSMGPLLLAFGIDGGRGVKELLALMDSGEGDGLTEDIFTEVGKHDDITYFAATAPEVYKDFTDSLSPEFTEEYHTLQAAFVEALKNAEYFTPIDTGMDMLGKTLKFEAKDLEGNTVRSEDLFGAHEYTMINIWATWCNPCKGEMEELGNMHRKYAETDVAIVGICLDADEELELCKEILVEKNVDYLNLLAYDGIYEELAVTTIPTSIFVNRDGIIVFPPIIGADLPAYERVFDALLSAVAPAAESAPIADEVRATASEK